MKTYTNLYKQLCSIENLELAFNKAKKRKTSKACVIKFEENLGQELSNLKCELESMTYKPKSLRRFIVRDPKTRTIHSSDFRDRVIHHALVNILEPIFEKIFIHDSYASRKDKGTLNAILRFDEFKRKVSDNGQLVNNSLNSNQVTGYVLKADIKHYFQTVDHELLLNIVKRKIDDENVIWLIKTILENFNINAKGKGNARQSRANLSSLTRKGMPLGNLTSQFFANVYLNDFDYFVKHKLKVRYYIRYVDDFVILDKNKNILSGHKRKINNYLKNLKIELHPDKSKIIPLRNGTAFLGYRIFYHHKMLRQANMRKFKKNFIEKLSMCKADTLSYDDFTASFQGWFGYAMWADTYKLRKRLGKEIEQYFLNEISSAELNRLSKCIDLSIKT